jgi:hypothetical protein
MKKLEFFLDQQLRYCIRLTCLEFKVTSRDPLYYDAFDV